MLANLCSQNQLKTTWVMSRSHWKRPGVIIDAVGRSLSFSEIDKISTCLSCSLSCSTQRIPLMTWRIVLHTSFLHQRELLQSEKSLFEVHQQSRHWSPSFWWAFLCASHLCAPRGPRSLRTQFRQILNTNETSMFPKTTHIGWWLSHWICLGVI